MCRVWLLMIVFYLLGGKSFAQQNDVKPDLKLSNGRMNIAGNLSFPIETNRHEQSFLGLNIGPQFGIFLAKNFELRSYFNLSAHYEFSHQEHLTDTPIFWDVGTDAIYYFETPWLVRPYLGIGLGLGFMGFNIYSLNVIADIPLGILISLHEDFAIDIGVPTRIRMAMRSLVDRVQVTPGLIGIRYFFN
jgi:hypothetical protein